MSEFWSTVIAIIIVVAIALAITAVIDGITCAGKTSNMGFEHRYGPIKGCQIEVNPGQWIPLESYYFKQE